MTTSSIFTKTAGKIIEEALRDARIIPVEQVVQAIDNKRGLDALNNIAKYWQNQAINLWKQAQAIIPLVVGQQRYLLGPALGDDECTDSDDFFNTTTDTAEAAGQTVIGVTSTANFTDGDRIGIALDDGTRHWTTIVSFVLDDTVTITTGLASAAASGNTVYTYTAKIQRPVRVLSARYANTIAQSEIPVNRWSRQEYFDQPDKDSSGTVNQFYYSPQLISGELFVWQVASDVNNVLRITYTKPALVYDATIDVLDYPSEFFLPLKWRIAQEIGPSYGLSPPRQLELKEMADLTLEEALSHDGETGSMRIVPDFS